MPHGLLAHFLAVIGAAGLTVPAGRLPRVNRRLGAKHLEVLRLTSLALDNSRPTVCQPAKSRLLAPLRRDLSALLAGDVPFAGLSWTQVQTITERFAESNACFAREYGIDPDGLLFRQMPADGVQVRPSRAAWDDLSDRERPTVRRLVHDTLSVDIADQGALATGTGAVAGGARLRHGVRKLLDAARGVFGPRGLPLLLSWLRWETRVRWLCLWPQTRPPAAGGRAVGGQQ